MTYSSLAGFWEEEVCKHTLSKGPDHKDDVSLPLDVLDGHGPGKLVEETGCVDEGSLDSHALCSDLKRNDFDWVERLKRCNVE